MPALSNARHERFAVELAKGASQSDAYAAAGYEPSEANASRLTRNDKVRTRVAEIQARGAIRAEVTLQSLIEEAEAARVLAMEIGQPAAAVGAIKEKGVLAGVRVEKSERKNTSDVSRLTDNELDAAIADALAREQEAARGSGLTH